MRCRHDDCGWHAIAPSDPAARKQYAEHIVAEHAHEVDADVPEGMVEVHVDGEWHTVTPAAAKVLHDEWFGHE